MDTVKVMTYLDDFGTNPTANTSFPSYPPGIALFQYVLQKLHVVLEGGSFSEWRAIYAYKLLTLSMIAPLFRNVRFSFIWGGAVLWLAAFVVPGLFFWDFYVSTLIDPILGVLSGIGLTYIIIYRNEIILRTISVCCTAFLLVLAKDPGLLFAGVLAVSVLVTGSLNSQQNRKRKSCDLVAFFAVLLSTAFPRVLWNAHLTARNVVRSFNEPFNLKNLLRVIQQEDNTWRQISWNTFFPKLFQNNIEMGWYVKIRLSFFLWLLVCIGIGFLFLSIIRSKDYYLFTISQVVLLISVIQLLLYTIGTAIAYTYQFPEAEALDHASLSRYLGVVYLGLIVVLFAIASVMIEKESNKHALVTVICTAILLLSSPWGILKAYATRMYVSESVQDRYICDQLAERLLTVVPKGKAWLIVQNDNGTFYHRMKFCLRPVQVQKGNWSFGETEGENRIDAEEWRDILCSTYDAVVLFWVDDYFVDHFGDLFEVPAEIQNMSIFTIDKVNKKLILAGS